jgi:hypothetical protein
MRYSVLIASLFLLGCGGSESGDSAETVDEAADEGADVIGATYHDALDKANAVEAMIEQDKADIDAALEEAEGDTEDDQ